MSGIKGATVRSNLNKVVNTVRSGISECERAAADAQSIGRADFTRQFASAEHAHKGVKRQLPAEIRAFLQGETAQWESLLREHDKKFDEGGELAAQADQRIAEFRSRKQDAESRLEQVTRGVEDIRRALRGKDWYCDAENAEAKRLRSQAEGILAGMRQNVILGREAQSLQRESLSAFAESEQLAQEAGREYDRLLNLAGERRERQRIKEENERKARNLQGDLESLKRSIESKNFAKFGGAVYTASERHELEDVLRLIGNGRYENAIPRAEALRNRLSAAATTIDAAQRAWESDRLAAERALADAREEVLKVERGYLAKYSGAEEGEIAAVFSTIDSAVTDMQSENFDKAKERTAAAIEKLRRLKEKSDDNRRLAEEREEMAQAIMQALYDANFDTPEYYLQDDDNTLSDMCVVAAAPGGVGDMKLRIDLTGGTKFEVCNIPEGHEQLCIDQIRNLQKNLAESDIRFDMTDWGRAKDQGKVHVDVRPKAQTVQQTIQRQG